MVNEWDREGVRLADAGPVDFHVKRAAAAMVFGAGSSAEHASLAILAYADEARRREAPSQ
jgi:3-isopropylmalate dehydratase small subunit